MFNTDIPVVEEILSVQTSIPSVPRKVSLETIITGFVVGQENDSTAVVDDVIYYYVLRSSDNGHQRS
jgi:hypothetical protein